MFNFLGYEGGVAYEITATDSKKFVNDGSKSEVPVIPTSKTDSSLVGTCATGTTDYDLFINNLRLIH